MILLNGIPGTDEHVRTLVDLLLRVGRAEDLNAAEAINSALTEQADAVDLSASRAVAVLGVLDDPPDGLVELRGKAGDRTQEQGVGAIGCGSLLAAPRGLRA